MAAHSTTLRVETECKPQDVHRMVCMGRTQGDGMENVTVDKNEAKQTKSRLGDTLIYHPTNLRQISSIPPVPPTGVIVNLVPKHVSSTKDEKHVLGGLKFKEPKFVPYEPYKAAVNSIVPLDKKNRRLCKTEVNVNVPISQVAALKIQEANANLKENFREKECAAPPESKWDSEKKMYETEIQKLKQENSELENQLKFQAQVNGELKNLLVAAVGEDLETRVHLLTEDKLQLARELLNSAQHLSTHQEQTEWLAGQCEVWRSKFLASSLMVEELAKWKAALSQRTTDLEEAIKRLLQEHSHVRELSLETYRTLSILRQTFDPVGISSPKKYDLQNANIVGLAKGCEQLAEILKVQLLSGMSSISSRLNINTGGLDVQTPAEKMAEQLLMSSKLIMSGRQEVACSAVVGAAVAVGGKMFFPGSESKMACCPHCSGEIKQL